MEKTPVNKLQKMLIGSKKSSRQTYDEIANATGISKSYLWELCNTDKCNPTYSATRSLIHHFDWEAKELFK